jgi:dienelactone hydrolase
VFISLTVIMLATLGATPEGPAVDAQASTAADLQNLQTNTGVQFTILGAKPPMPAPTLFVFAMDAKGALGDQKYRRCGNFLIKEGYLCVSVDLPCHGAEHRSDEPEGLAGWRKRIDANEDPIADLNARLTKVLDYLIEQHWTDPEKVVACGTSRGGFAALHFAAADPRVKAVAAYSPVTDLSVLGEFHGLQDATLAGQLSLVTRADKLANRGVWIAIGDRDGRVGTDQAIQFARRLSAAAATQSLPSRVELHVAPSNGHHTPAGAEEQSANWIKTQLSSN